MTGASRSVLAFLGLGSNLGDRSAMLRAAVRALDEHTEIAVDFGAGVSSLYESRPSGGPPGQGDFLNACVRVDTTLGAQDLLDTVCSIEASLGRVRQTRWGERTIDIDLLLYGEAVIDGEALSVPHVRLRERRFVLEPLAEIAGSAIHPVCGRTIAALLRALDASDAGPCVAVETPAWATGLATAATPPG